MSATYSSPPASTSVKQHASPRGGNPSYRIPSTPTQPMDARQSDYQQSGSFTTLHAQLPHRHASRPTFPSCPPTLHPMTLRASVSLPSVNPFKLSLLRAYLPTFIAEQPPTAPYPPQQDPRGTNFSSATPSSDYALPTSARSESFPSNIYSRPHYSPSQGPSQGGMAHPPSPSMPLHSSHASNQTSQSARSNNEVPIDPSIAASPTYPPQSQYPTYQTQPDMYGAGHPGVYGRPEWASGHYQQPPPMTHYGHSTSSGPPSAGLVSPVNHPPAVRPI
jgi:hypothetical protein